MSESFDQLAGFDTRAAQFETRAVRSGTERSQFSEHSKALFLTSSFVFDSAAQAAARFSGVEAGNVYSRFTNPTVTMFERRLASLRTFLIVMRTFMAIATLALLLCLVGLAGQDALSGSITVGAFAMIFFLASYIIRSATYASSASSSASATCQSLAACRLRWSATASSASMALD